MSNYLKLFLLATSFTLVACEQGPKKEPTRKPMVEVETPDFSLNNNVPQEEVVDSALPESTTSPAGAADVLLEKFSLNEVKSAMEGFSLNNEDQFSNCAYYAVKNCESQTVYAKVQETKNVNLCDLLGEGEATACRDSLWRELAIMENDASLCEKINEEYSQKDCLNNLYRAAAVAGKDAALCEKIVPYVVALPESIDPVDPEGVTEELLEALPATVPSDNYLREECERQVNFSVEFEQPISNPEDIPVDSIQSIEEVLPVVETGDPAGAAVIDETPVVVEESLLEEAPGEEAPIDEASEVPQ